MGTLSRLQTAFPILLFFDKNKGDAATKKPAPNDAGFSAGVDQAGFAYLPNP